MSTRRYGYARISTGHQTHDQQVDALVGDRDYPVAPEHVFTDTISGAKFDRPGLTDLLRHLREGDELVVVRLDRLGRSLHEMITLTADLERRGVILISLGEKIDFSTPAGRLMAAVFMALAEYEKTLTAERVFVAREAARARGKQTGRPKTITDAKIAEARALLAEGKSKAETARLVGIGRASLYRVLEEVGA